MLIYKSSTYSLIPLGRFLLKMASQALRQQLRMIKTRYRAEISRVLASGFYLIQNFKYFIEQSLNFIKIYLLTKPATTSENIVGVPIKCVPLHLISKINFFSARFFR